MDLLNINCEQYKLKNGLDIILYHDSSLPVVSSNIWYRTGSANEHKGKTGIAHLFEHMMFQGSQNVQKEMHFRYIQEAGGSLNGSTSFDRTNYYEKVPSNFLELILWLESDRMGYLLPAMTQEKLDNQKGVVSNERLERYDNQPYGLAWELVISTLYPEGHPYSWPTIGSLQDISNFTLEDVHSFFTKHYSPANASLVLAGDFETAKAKELIEKYFGILDSPAVPGPVAVPKTELPGNKMLVHEDNVQLERIYLAWPTLPAYADGDNILDVLSDILSGSKNSRLYKNLVFDNEIAQDVSAFQFSGKYAGHFMIIATAKPGVSLEQLKIEIFSELDKIKKDGVTDKELTKSKNGIKSGFIYSLQNIDSLADQLNHYSYYLGEPNSFAADLARYQKVDSDAVKSHVEKYFAGPYVELRVVPKKGKD